MTVVPPTTGLDPDRIRDSVRALFRSPPGPPRVGLEVEALPVLASTRASVPPEAAAGPALAPLLRAWAAPRGWSEGRTPAGSPVFVRPGGGTLSFEPGGQLEYATPPLTSLPALDAHLEEVLRPLARELARSGVELTARGVDPINPLEGARLHVAGERYRRMADHYARRGPWGRRMMRQSAALHVNVDAPGEPGEAWAVANAAAPALLAVFANSPRIDGRDSGLRSARAAQWRRLDPTRTGLPRGTADREADYLAFAMDADAFLLGPADEPARPFRDWASRATEAEWIQHLGTLFPEVRPRGYLEVRSVDALPLELVILPAAILVGLLFDPATRRRAARELPAPTPLTLEAAGCAGLADPGVAGLVRAVMALAREGLAALDPTVAGPGIVERLDRFRVGFTDRGRDPGHRADDRLAP